jgi:hypothetical protein
VQHGEIFAWFPSGRSSEKPEVAYVNRINARTVSLLTATRGVKETVRHVQDPKLKGHAEQRENGAWDFSEFRKQQTELLNDIERRLKLVERLVSNNAVSRPTNEKLSAKQAEYQELRDKAKSLGVEMRGTPTREWLEEQIREALVTAQST